MDKLEDLSQLVLQRIADQKDEIQRSLRQIAAGNPLGSETQQDRLTERIAIKTGMREKDASMMARMIAHNAKLIESAANTQEPRPSLPGHAATAIASARRGAESVQGASFDFVGIEFLTRGRLAANTVGRVVFKTGRAQGSGFLVGPGLFLTNNHVISSAEMASQLVVEFDYENDGLGAMLPVTTFAFNPDKCFINAPTAGLDFALIAIGTRLSGAKPLQAFGFNPLSDARDKHALGEFANIIQHPQGQAKQLVVRENNLISRDETKDVLHYLADTDSGASGSSVCNSEWEPIALHHWGSPALEVVDLLGQPLRSDVNEGIRISSIVRQIKQWAPALQGANGESVRGLLETWAALPRSGPVAPSAGPEFIQTGHAEAPTQPAGGVQHRIADDGAITWTLPLEFSVRMPFGPATDPAAQRSGTQAAAVQARGTASATSGKPQVHQTAEAAKAATTGADFHDRGGYEPGFITGFVVPLPQAGKAGYRLSLNAWAPRDDDPHELPYHHFSIVMNADRALCAVTACNIDGRRIVHINRDTGAATENPSLGQLQLNAESAGGAEATDAFRPDPRIPLSEQMHKKHYDRQQVPGHILPPKPRDDAPKPAKHAYYEAVSERTARMLQKGHVTLRSDPAWGTVDEARRAESDTFFYTNVAPQFGFFNQGSAIDEPGSKGKLRWRALETYVLRNAITARQRVCVFAGPVFKDTDPQYRFGTKVPMQFWKIAVWKDAQSQTLRAIALLADQTEVFKRYTEGMPEGMQENYDDLDELARAGEFLSTVEEIQQLTRLQFGEAVLNADIRKGGDPRESMQALQSLQSLQRPAP